MYLSKYVLYRAPDIMRAHDIKSVQNAKGGETKSKVLKLHKRNELEKYLSYKWKKQDQYWGKKGTVYKKVQTNVVGDKRIIKVYCTYGRISPYIFALTKLNGSFCSYIYKGWWRKYTVYFFFSQLWLPVSRNAHKQWGHVTKYNSVENSILPSRTSEFTSVIVL